MYSGVERANCCIVLIAFLSQIQADLDHAGGLTGREMVSVIFCWLRNERGRKCFSHTLLGDWVKGGVKVIRVTFLLASC